MYGYIYMTINILNGKRYIGQHKSDKFLTKYKYAGSGRRLNISIKKYGLENFAIELLDTAESLDELNSKEWYWIEIYNAVESDMFYNEIPGGQVIDVSGSNNPNYGNHKLKGKKFTKEHKRKIGESMTGKITVNNGFEEKKINENELDYFKSIGFSIGVSKERIRRISENSSNRVRINNGETEKFVKVEELEYYLSNGYKRGLLREMNMSESTKDKIRNSKIGKIVINNGLEVKRVTKEEYETIYVGWNRGFLDKTKRKMSERSSGSNNPMYGRIRRGNDAPTYGKHINVGKRWMNNGLENKFVNENDQCRLLELGWKFGMIRKVK